MNKLSIHNITGITISREIFERGSGTDFTVINITATDDTGRSTCLTCFVEPGYPLEPCGTIDLATNYIAA